MKDATFLNSDQQLKRAQIQLELQLSVISNLQSRIPTLSIANDRFMEP